MVKEKTLPVRLDRFTDENLRRLAEAEGRTKAGLVRWLVNRYASERLDQHTTRPCLTDRNSEVNYAA